MNKTSMKNDATRSGLHLIRTLACCALLMAGGNGLAQPAKASRASPKEVRYLQVNKYFLLSDIAGGTPGSIVSCSWKDDRLWLGVMHGTQGSTTGRAVQAVDLGTLRAAAPAIPLPWTGQFAECPFGDGGFYTVDHGNLFAVLPQGKIRICNLVSGAVRDIDAGLPPETTSTLTALDGHIYLLTTDRILELDPDSGSIQILASKRRRPPANVLDTLDWKGNPLILADSQGKRTLLMPDLMGHAIYHEGATMGAWINAGKTSASRRELVSAVDGNLLMNTGQSGHGEIQLLTATNIMPLHSKSRPAAGQWGRASVMMEIFGVAGKMGGMVFQETFTAWNGTHLWALCGRGTTEMSPFSNPPFKVQSSATNAQAILWYFDPRWQHALEIPLKFSLGTGDVPAGMKAFQQRLEGKAVSRIFATPKGLLIMLPEDFTDQLQAGFWFIPQAELDEWSESAWRSSPPQPNIHAARLAQFDANHNGALDPEEVRAYGKSPEYQLATSREKAIELIAQFDVDMDGSLQEEEVWRGYSNLNELFSLLRYKYNVVGLVKEDYHPLMSGYDENKDSKLDVDEVAKLLRNTNRSTPPPGSAPPTLPKITVPAP
jgi:hypothetical protein